MNSKKHFFITGHTGFIGSYLCKYLSEKGYLVSGFSKDIPDGSYFEKENIASLLKNNFQGNILNKDNLQKSIEKADPDYIIHLAAQRLVRLSYSEPELTWQTNVIGTVNLLEILNQAQHKLNIKSLTIATTDKVYLNNQETATKALSTGGFVESDPLGAQDPMSSSKAATDLVAQSYNYNPNFNIPVGVVRMANQIGGGEVAKDVLLVDIINALKENKQPELRMPNAVRPWQHVLDCCSALELVALSCKPEAFNVAAPKENQITVGEVTKKVIQLWNGPIQSYKFTGDNDGLREESLLTLSSSKIEKELGWKNQYNIDQALKMIVDYEK